MTKKLTIDLSEDTDWDFLYEKNHISVYSLHPAGSKLIAFRGDSVLPCSMGTLYTLISEAKYRRLWIDRVSEIVMTMENYQTNESCEYSLIGMPFPIKDRYFYTYTIAKYYPKEKLIHAKSRDNHEAMEIEEPDAIRASLIDSNFKLQFIDDKETFISISMLIDPCGLIPIHLVNLLQSEWAYNTLSRLGKLCEDDGIDIAAQYQNLLKGK